MKILMIGDVVGGPGRRILQRELKKLRAERGIDAVVVNAENCAAGSGITAALANEIFDAGADAITLGDHTWDRRNSPGRSPGSSGWCVPRTMRRTVLAGDGHSSRGRPSASPS